MRCLVSAVTLAACCAALAPRARADGASADLSFAALPAVHRVGAAAPFEREVAVFGGMGFGFASAVIEAEDSHQRALGSLAASVGVLRWLAVALRVDGRYDRHVGLSTGADDGLVGDPRLLVRVGGALGGSLHLGAQLGVWLPGADAPSVVLDATTVDAQLLATLGGPGSATRLSLNLGARLDRSARSIDPAEADMLSQPDRLALGLSESNAVLVGLGVTRRVGPAELLGEWTWDLLVGDQAPGLRGSPMRVAGGARLALSDALAAQVVVEANAAQLPTGQLGEPLVPFEPRVTLSAGVAYRFGAARQPRRLVDPDAGTAAEPAPAPSGLASVRVRVVTAGGAPVDGAAVELASGDRTIVLAPGDDGAFELGELEPGSASLSIKADGYKPATRAVSLRPGVQTDVQVGLERELPPGQIRGAVRSYRGAAVKARLTIEPGSISIETGADGTFEADVAPGEYEVTIEADGYATQRRPVTVKESGVVIINADLQRTRKKR